MNEIEINNSKPKKQSAKGRKAMLIIGIILLNISLFLAAFVFSYTLILNPVGEHDAKVQTLTDENDKLRSDVQLLQDQIDVVQSELDTYKNRYGSSSSSSARSTSGNSSSSSNSDDDEDDDREESRSSSSGDREINLDND